MVRVCDQDAEMPLESRGERWLLFVAAMLVLMVLLAAEIADWAGMRASGMATIWL